MSNRTGLILWLHPTSLKPSGRTPLLPYFRQTQIEVRDIVYISIDGEFKDGVVKKGQRFIGNEMLSAQIQARINALINEYRPSAIVVNSDLVLKHTYDTYGKLQDYRGSIYNFGTTPCMVIDSVTKISWSNKGERPQHHYPWVMLNDISKLSRLQKKQLKPHPKFNWFLCTTTDELDMLRRVAENAKLIAIDIENSYDFITVVGYSIWMADGSVCSFVIPFFGGTVRACWLDEDVEELAWKVVKEINENSVPKIMQNGLYDQSYFITYHMPVYEWVHDTATMFRAVWASAPRSLAFISSIMLDNYCFWKDESKGDREQQKKNEKVINTEADLFNYWQYNAKDTFYTLLSCIELVRRMPEWARINYIDTMTQALGPASMMTYYGMPVNRDRLEALHETWRREADEALRTVRIMADDPDFNPRSSPQVIDWLFDTLQAKPPLRGQDPSSDEKVLRLVRTQHPILARAIDAIWDYKKPEASISKYGEKLRLAGGSRFIYMLDPTATETMRYAAKQHPLGYGTNSQNLPSSIRHIFVADPSYVLLSVDYAQSDAYYTAFTLEDPAMIEELLGDKDSHCLLAAHFFQKPYEEIYEGYKADAEWVVDPIKGVRQNTKRIRYGANYLMRGRTLYVTMGHEAVVATAVAMGHADASNWTVKECIDFAESLITAYWKRYHVAARNLDRLIEKAARVDKQRFVNAWGNTRLFFGNLQTDDAVMREFASQIGQSGTAGAINRAFKAVVLGDDYYFIRNGGWPLLQVHDELLLTIPVDRLDLVDWALERIAQPCTINGQNFTVPVDAKLGFSWKKSTVSWPCTLEQVTKAEEKLNAALSSDPRK